MPPPLLCRKTEKFQHRGWKWIWGHEPDAIREYARRRRIHQIVWIKAEGLPVIEPLTGDHLSTIQILSHSIRLEKSVLTKLLKKSEQKNYGAHDYRNSEGYADCVDARPVACITLVQLKHQRH